MATNDITISASNSAQHEQQQSDSVRIAIAAITFASGGIPTIHIENENTGEIAAMTPESAAMDLSRTKNSSFAFIPVYCNLPAIVDRSDGKSF